MDLMNMYYFVNEFFLNITKGKHDIIFVLSFSATDPYFATYGARSS